MSNKQYVDNLAAPMLATLDKAKDELVEKLKNKLIDELDVNEKMRTNQVKLEEQMKTEVEKSSTLEAKIRTLEEILATKEEVIKMLTDGADRERFIQGKMIRFYNKMEKLEIELTAIARKTPPSENCEKRLTS